MATFSLDTGTVPEGTPFPSTVQGFLDLIKSYVEVTGLGESETGNLLAGVLQQSTTPAVGQADMLWVQMTDGTNAGRPAALNAYQSNGWKPLSTVNSGTTTARPANPLVGEFYYDTDISCLLIKSASGWSTAEGSLGDIKFSHASDAATVLTRNPGWEIYTAAQGKSLVAVDPLDTEDISGTDVYKSSGNSLGAKTHELASTEIPYHTHEYQDKWIQKVGQYQSDNSGTDPGDNYTTDTRQTGPYGGDSANSNITVPHENRPPLITAFCLKKEF